MILRFILLITFSLYSTIGFCAGTLSGGQDQDVSSGATPTFTGTNITGIPTTGITDGDKGSITNTGGSLTIDAGAVDTAELADDAVTAAKIDSTIDLTVNSLSTAASATPHWTQDDSDVAGIDNAKIYLDCTGTDCIQYHQVDVAGTLTTFIEIDGVSETVDILKPLVVTGDVSATTATITGLVTSGTISSGAGGMTVDADGALKAKAEEIISTGTETLTILETSGTLINNDGNADGADHIITFTDFDTFPGPNFIVRITDTMSTNDFCVKAAADDIFTFEGTDGAANGCICNASPTHGDKLVCAVWTNGATAEIDCEASRGTWAIVADNTGDCPD